MNYEQFIKHIKMNYDLVGREQMIFTLNEFYEKFPLWQGTLDHTAKRVIKVELLARDGSIVRLVHEDGEGCTQLLTSGWRSKNVRTRVPLKCTNRIYDTTGIKEPRECGTVEVRDQFWVPGWPHLVTKCSGCGYVATHGYVCKRDFPHESDTSESSKADVPEIFPL